MTAHNYEWDVFISHASEDKDAFVRPLAQALTALGVSVWYDEFSLRLGDSLSSKIDFGLANSRYGIVVISPSFVAKPWPQRELRGLVAREVAGRSTILPVWHNIDVGAVADFSPPLADVLAVRTADLSATQIALQILSVVKPAAFAEHTYDELVQISHGEAFAALRDELEVTKEQLSEFLCPACQAPLVTAIEYPIDTEHKHWGIRRSFECGRMESDGVPDRRCPDDPEHTAASFLDVPVIE